MSEEGTPHFEKSFIIIRPTRFIIPDEVFIYRVNKSQSVPFESALLFLQYRPHLSPTNTPNVSTLPVGVKGFQPAGCHASI
jgi:hypothetical protein